MLSAHEARQITEENNQDIVILKAIEREIKSAARQGKNEVLYDCGIDANDKTVASVIQTLRNIYGYKVHWVYGLTAFLIMW